MLSDFETAMVCIQSRVECFRKSLSGEGRDGNRFPDEKHDKNEEGAARTA
jgi:hypothetical protein